MRPTICHTRLSRHTRCSVTPSTFITTTGELLVCSRFLPYSPMEAGGLNTGAREKTSRRLVVQYPPMLNTETSKTENPAPALSFKHSLIALEHPQRCHSTKTQCLESQPLPGPCGPFLFLCPSQEEEESSSICCHGCSLQLARLIQRRARAFGWRGLLSYA